MVICQLKGGLGNQMFQYAAAKALALRLKQELCLDISNFDKEDDGRKMHEIVPDGTKDPYRPYELEKVFSVKEKYTKDFSCRKIDLHTFFFRLGQYVHSHIEFPFFSDILLTDCCRKQTNLDRVRRLKECKAHKNIYLCGYWQSPLYFDDCEQEIRRKFSFSPLKDEKNQATFNILYQNPNSVAIHVRRGELTYSRYNLSLPVAYYQEAIRRIKSYIRKPQFIVFSEDQEWCKNNLPVPDNTIFCDWNPGEKAYIYLQLMSACSHFIIANSTFSWWGAYLSSNQGKIIFAPQGHWFANSGAHDKIYYPKEWLLLK